MNDLPGAHQGRALAVPDASGSLAGPARSGCGMIARLGARIGLVFRPGA